MLLTQECQCLVTVVSRLFVPIAICSLHSITRHVINERHNSSFHIQNSNCVSTVCTGGGLPKWRESDNAELPKLLAVMRTRADKGGPQIDDLWGGSHHTLCMISCFCSMLLSLTHLPIKSPLLINEYKVQIELLVHLFTLCVCNLIGCLHFYMTLNNLALDVWPLTSPV